MKYVLIKDERLGYLFATKTVNWVEKTVSFQMFSCPDCNAIFCTEEGRIQKWAWRHARRYTQKHFAWGQEGSTLPIEKSELGIVENTKTEGNYSVQRWKNIVYSSESTKLLRCSITSKSPAFKVKINENYQTNLLKVSKEKYSFCIKWSLSVFNYFIWFI